MPEANNDNVQLRLAFEAYAQMGSKLHPLRNHFEVNDLLKKHLKYLFNFEDVRISYIQHKQVITHLINHAESDILIEDFSILTAFEKELIKQKKTVIQQPTTGNYNTGWYFESADNDTLLLSVHSKQEKNVVMSLAVLKLLAESLMAKFLQFNLYDKLDKQNDEISRALSMLTRQNQEIQALVEEQREEILRQTEAVRAKNKQLRKIAKLNAHEVREPLTRILALTKLLRLRHAFPSYEELTFIEEASIELDKALRHTIRKAETELKS